jgi:hypothetical protein
MEAKLILNIGLNRASGGAITAEQARQTLAANEFLIVRDAVLESDTEPTLVAEVISKNSSPFIFLQLLRRVAEELDQDCIAVYRELTGAGSLIGPRSAEWGPFKAEFFLLLDGRRLSETIAA